MEFQNRIDQLDFPKQQQTALDILRDYMISKSIIVIEHDDLFIGDVIFNKEPDLAMFRYKKVNKGVFWSLNLIDIFVITFTILLYSFSEVMASSTRTESFSIKSPKKAIDDQSKMIKYCNFYLNIISF